MNVRWFLKERTNFIRFFYDQSVSAFVVVKHQIEHELPPYDDPPYSEDGEPAFLEEWMDADMAIELAGLACVSLLSDSLKLYFNTLQKRVIGFSFDEQEKAVSKQQGFPAAYRLALSAILDTDWSDCPADFAIIEQVVLARNRGQHGEDISSFRSTYDAAMVAKHPRPLFASTEEMSCLTSEEGSLASFLMPSIKVSRESLFLAIEQVELLADWIESRMPEAHAWRLRQRAASRHEAASAEDSASPPA